MATIKHEKEKKEYWMYIYKVQPCQRKRKYNKANCPFAHPGEIESRRHPNIYSPSTPCYDFLFGRRCRRRKRCRGERCKFAHGLNESLFHPDWFRKDFCQKGRDCDRKVCSFAHNTFELRGGALLKWEDVPEDCLIQVFQTMTLKDLVTKISFVCKSWNKAGSNSNCWKILNFSFLSYYSSSFIKSCIDRSRGAAIEVYLGHYYHTKLPEVLTNISDRCPALRFLAIPYWPSEEDCDPKKLICNWTCLEGLSFWEEDRYTQIGIYCKNFVWLFTEVNIRKEEASAIVKFLPHVKHLSLRWSRFDDPDSLKLILAGCQELESLDRESL